MIRKSFLALVLLVIGGCGPAADEPNSAITNYHQDIKPLVKAHCLSCHRQGDIGLYPLETFDQVKAMGPAMVTAVENRNMPPWGQNPECRPSQNSLRLDDDVVSIFSQWQEHGFEEGDPSQPQSEVAQAIEQTEVTEPNELLGPSEPYIPNVGLGDDYRCLILPYEFDKTTFIYKNTIYPDRLDLVHHVIVYVASEKDRDYFEEKDADSEEPGFACFGGTGVDDAQMLGGWAPGQFNAPGDKSHAQQISKGSLLIMQMHYNLAGKTVEDVIDGDETHLAIWTLEEGDTPDYLFSLMPIFDFGINIPPYEASWPEESLRRLPVDAQIIGTAPHMHLLGKSIKVELLREDGATECLTQIDEWDFDWQRTYMFPDNLTIPMTIDDQIHLECVYDNSEDNQPVIAGEKQTPKQTSWGDGTTDEMCLNYLVIAAPYRGDGKDGFCAGFENCLAECPEGDGFCALACPGTLGLQCLGCAIEGFFGECAQSKCGLTMLSVGSCYESCSTDNYFDFFDCIHGPCRDAFNNYYACMDPYLRDGTCADDFSDCDGMYSE